MWIFYLIALSRRWVSPWRRRLFGSMRVCAYMALVAGVSSVLLARRALGRMHDESALLSRELLPLADLLDGITAVRINGERLNVSITTVADTSVQAVLDRLERHCQENPGPLALTLRQLADDVPDLLPRAEEARALLRRAALSREEVPGGGSVLCFTGVQGGAVHDRLGERFAGTSDLGVFGNLRYATVRHGEASQGEGEQVKVMALFTEGSFRLSSLEPPLHGDAPGSDSEVVPRPPGSVRLFAAEAVGVPYAVRIYETTAPPAAVLAFYDQAMHDFASPIEAGDEPVRAYIKLGKPVLVNVDTDAEKTLVTLSEVGVHADASNGPVGQLVRQPVPQLVRR